MTDEKPCRHEYVKIYQRKLKGLERRLVGQRAYLPIGFKQTDFGHLSEGSYCFCTKCRARLFPRRTNAEKAAARLALQQGKLAAEAALLDEAGPDAEVLEGAETSQEAAQDAAQDAAITQIHVEELELESVDMQDIEADGVKLTTDDEESGSLADDEDL